jgi:hypothetical protein
MIGKAHGWGTFPQNMGSNLAIASSLAPYFENAPTLGALPYIGVQVKAVRALYIITRWCQWLARWGYIVLEN